VRLWRGSDEKRIDEFWQWWAEHRSSVLSAAGAGEEGMPHLVGLLDWAVDGLSRDVAWEFGPGSQRPWQLILSPGGVRSVLPFTVAWPRPRR
jgi:hypothetical protein